MAHLKRDRRDELVQRELRRGVEDVVEREGFSFASNWINMLTA